jgi:hypothetical protein
MATRATILLLRSRSLGFLLFRRGLLRLLVLLVLLGGARAVVSPLCGALRGPGLFPQALGFFLGATLTL